MSIKQRWNTKKQTDSVLVADTKQNILAIFPYVSNLNLSTDGFYCSFSIENTAFSSFKYNSKPNKKEDCSPIDLSTMTDDEILKYVKTNPIEQAQEVHNWLLANVYN